MRNDIVIEVTGAADPRQHEAEAQRRWGGSDAFRESRRRTKRYGKREWEEVRASFEALCQALAAELDAGRAPDSPTALALAEQLRQHIDRWFYPCSHAMHRSLGELYVDEPRFAENFWRIRPGLAAYVRDAIRANAARHGA